MARAWPVHLVIEIIAHHHSHELVTSEQHP